MQPEEFANKLVASMPDALVFSDEAGTIQIWNRGASRMFGFTAEEAIGQSLDLIIPPGLRERHWHGFRATMQSGRTKYGEREVLAVPAIRKDGARISVEFTIVPFTDAAGRMTGMAAIMRDVTRTFDELRALRKKAASSNTE